MIRHTNSRKYQWLLVATVILLGANFANAQYVPPAAYAAPALLNSPNPADLKIWPVKGNIFMIIGAGANVVASVGLDGVVLVDTGTAANGDKVLAAVKRIQDFVLTVPKPFGYASETRSFITQNSIAPAKPVRYIINTSIDADHTGGNEKISMAGDTISGGNVGGYAPEGSAILSHENVLTRMSDPSLPTPTPFRALPTDTYYTEQYKLSSFFNGEGVLLISAPKAHTDGDTMVYFRGSDVLAVGDVFNQDTYPVIDEAKGGTIQGVLDALNHILDIAIPEFRTEGGTMIVPGHGRLSDSADVGYYRDMVTIIRDRIQNMKDKGMTLAQIQASRPTMDYDPRFGTSQTWTPAMFVEAIYNTLGK
jgi:glyoxylase-like metal-dependent hydrolase (beta-lactamase superfamily II)